MGDAVQSLTSGRLLARSVFWNFMGMVVPIIVAVVAIPLLLSGMGTARFGLLAIIWMGVGYFSFFDMGLGRALTKMVSARLGQGEVSDLGSLIWTAFFLLTSLGVLGALLLILFSNALVTGLLKVPDELHGEGVAAFRILAVGLPIVIVTAGLVGLLQAHQRFGTIAAIRIPLGILTYAGPLVSLQFTPSIASATAVLLLGRVASLIAYYWAASRLREELRRPRRFERREVRPLMAFGGWLTVTNVIGPLMTYLDRFFIGALLGMSAVAYYVTPYEVLSRLQMLPGAVMGVLFPAMAAAHVGDRDRLTTLYEASGRVIYWAMLPLTGGAFLLAPEALKLWLGEEFRVAATPVVHWLAAGWMINTLARPAFTVLQSAGRPDLVAKAHLAELIPYLGLLWWATSEFGIVGTAAAWGARVAADTVILNAIAVHTLPQLRALVMRAYLTLFVTSLAFGAFWMLDSFALRVFALSILACAAFVSLRPIARRALVAEPPTHRPDH